MSYPSCTGPCGQGDNTCPCKEACRLPEDGSSIGFGMAICALSAVAVCAAIVMVFA